MVGQRFCERLVEFDTERRFRIVTFCEEPRAAYDRVGLTSFFAHRDAEKLMLARQRVVRGERRRAARRRPGDCDRPRRSASCARTRASRSPTTTSCWPPARSRSCRRCRASTSRACSSTARSRTCENIIDYAEHVEALRGDRRRAAGAGSGQGGVRPGPGNARRRVRPAADAAADRRRRLADPGPQDRVARRAGASQQGDEGDPRQRPRRADGVRRRRARSTSTWSSSRPASGRATSWPGRRV